VHPEKADISLPPSFRTSHPLSSFRLTASFALRLVTSRHSRHVGYNDHKNNNNRNRSHQRYVPVHPFGFETCSKSSVKTPASHAREHSQIYAGPNSTLRAAVCTALVLGEKSTSSLQYVLPSLDVHNSTLFLHFAWQALMVYGLVLLTSIYKLCYVSCWISSDDFTWVRCNVPLTLVVHRWVFLWPAECRRSCSYCCRRAGIPLTKLKVPGC
jgi:hypothetical protein